MFFHLAVQFSRYILRPIPCSACARLSARIFQILCAFRFAFAHPSDIKNLSIPENDTSSRRTFQSTPDSSSGLFSLLHLSVYRPEMKRSDFSSRFLPRKEVIQPHLPIRLPCYDFTPITSFTFGGVLLAVRLPTSGPPGSHGVTGGVYKARERIHRGMLIRDY